MVLVGSGRGAGRLAAAAAGRVALDWALLASGCWWWRVRARAGWGSGGGAVRLAAAAAVRVALDWAFQASCCWKWRVRAMVSWASPERRPDGLMAMRAGPLVRLALAPAALAALEARLPAAVTRRAV